ncbi:MAG: PAS domain-containing protein, partial [Microvirga sp.]
MKTINFEALFSASPNPYVLLDLSLTIVGMNDAYLHVTMRKREDLLGRNMFEAFPSDPDSSSHRQLRGSLEKVVREKTADYLSLIEYAIPLPSGQGFEERYWSATHTPLFNHNGEMTFILQHTVDVTELHRLRNLARTTILPSGPSALIETDMFRRAQAVQEANQALSEERQHLRGLFQQAPGFMAALGGPDHVFTMANAAYLQLIGRENIVGKPVRDALPEVVGQGFIDLLDRVYHSGQPFVGRSIRVHLRQSSGDVREERFLDFVYQPIFDPDGQVSGIFVQGHDVTEQKRSEEALRESEERFRAIANSIDQLIWATQPDGHHDYYNQRWYEYTGVPEGSTDGEAWNGMFHPDDQERAWGVWRHCLATGEPYHIEYRLRHRSGEYRWVLGRAQAVRDEEGRIKRWFGTCTDIHDLRQAQDALRESRERALRTEEETRRLASILAERVTELDAANEEIQRFAYIVSHDLRAPLVNVMGFTSELEGAQAEIERFYRNVRQADSNLISPEIRAAIESDLPEAIGFIRSSTVKMDKLIRAILKLSREGRRVLAPEPIDMAQLLEAQRHSVAHQLHERSAILLIEPLPDLTSDRLAIEQIFG